MFRHRRLVILSKENIEHFVHNAVYPLREHPEEEDDKNKTDNAADVDKLLRRFFARYYLVDGKDDGATVKGINRQNVQNSKNER